MITSTKPWLPRGLEFLSGLPEARKLLMIIQAFVDESISHNENPVFVMSGLISDTESWASFSNEWQHCLGCEPSIQHFKLSDAVKLDDQFHKFDEEMRDQKLRELAQIINRYAKFSVVSGIDLKAHRETHHNVKKPFRDPYFMAYYSMILGFAFDLYEGGLRQPFEIIFDEQKIAGAHAKKYYPTARKNICNVLPHLGAILPVEPGFEKDEDFLPLQAADLFAGCYMRNANRPKKDLLHWLLNEMPNVRGSKHSSFYDLNTLRNVIQKATAGGTNTTILK